MRERINDGQAFREEVARRISQRECTNFFMAEDRYLALIAEGKLYRMDFDGGAYFFSEEEGQYDLFYFLKEGVQPPAFSDFPLPVILEEVCLAAKPRMPSEDMWRKVGFLPHLTRKRLVLPVKKAPQEVRKPFFATEDRTDEILTLMEESFDPFTSALPKREVLTEDIRQKRVLAVMEEDKLLGFLRFERTKQSETLWQVAVTPDARGKGIAENLVRDWLYLEKENTNKFMLWVRLDNSPALKMYEKIGFLPDGRIAPVMIKPNKKG